MSTLVPYDWVDLNHFDELLLTFGEQNANYLLDNSFNYDANSSDFSLSLEQHTTPIPIGALAEKNQIHGRGLLSVKDIKLDAFHQTIIEEQVNEKEKAVAEELYLRETEWYQLQKEYPTNLNCMISPSGLFLRVSENCKEIVGQRVDQLVGTNITNHIHISELSNFYDQINLVVNGNRQVSFTHQFKTCNSYVSLDVVYFPCQGSNRSFENKCFFATASKSKAVLPEPSSPPQMFVPKKFVTRLSFEGIYIYASPHIKDVLGFSPNELVGKTMYELYNESDFQKISEVNHRIRRDTTENISVQCQMKKKDGSLCDMEVIFSVFRNPVSGLLECILCSCMDISKEEENPALIEKLKHEVNFLKQLLASKNLEVERLKNEKNALQESREDEENKKRKRRKVRVDLQCEECGTKESPEWRKGPSGNQSLCNACGLRYAKKLRSKKENELGLELTFHESTPKSLSESKHKNK